VPPVSRMKGNLVKALTNIRVAEYAIGAGDMLWPLSRHIWDDQSRETWEGPVTAVKALKE
jgi:hypothetical protein